MSLTTRLSHPHYTLNSLLTLPLPLLLSLHLKDLIATHELERNSIAALVLTPVLSLPIVTRGAGEMAESRFETITWNLKVFNLIGLGLMKDNLGLGWNGVGIYAVAWFLISFFYPQPPYLGPSKLTTLTSEDFDERIAILPPSQTLSPDSGPSRILTDDYDSLSSSYASKRKSSTAYFVILCHAEWSRKSRELERTLSHLSTLYSSPTLSFHLLDPSLSPQTFYDLNLSIHPTSLDLPKVYLFHKGKVVGELPKGLREVDRERKEDKKTGKKRWLVRSRKGRRKGSGSESESDASDEERENERRVAVERYKWDRSAESIIKAFKLIERSGLSQTSTKLK